ncbi:hypothetical protein [uncultured Rikenella sp.]|nr:hypothetical protein [uncultured Rikenella sp.]
MGSGGYGWSSDISGFSGLDLNFGPQYLSSDYKGSRGHGFQLRCLSE